VWGDWVELREAMDVSLDVVRSRGVCAARRGMPVGPSQRRT
jgi:hypothetical protein